MGKSTLQEMNVSIEDRIGQFRANLERLRWTAGSLSPDFIVVNIAGFELYLYHNNTLSWTTNVMTGSEKTETPVFKSTIHYLVLNPYLDSTSQYSKIYRSPRYPERYCLSES
jgi:murein L,D-transpeptidase YcbB/YkuD